MDLEVPEGAFEDEIVDPDFQVTPLDEDLIPYVEDDRARDRLTTEFGTTPIPDKRDAAYAIDLETGEHQLSGRRIATFDIRVRDGEIRLRI